MKLSMKLTLDDLVRALRWKAHELAEQAALGLTPDATTSGAQSDDARERRDDRSGR